MAWQKFTRTRSVDRETPILSVTKSHFCFNGVAARMFDLRDGKRVVYHIDEEARKIGFEFTHEDVEHSFSVFAKAGSATRRSSSQYVVRNHPWVNAVAVLQKASERRFRLRREGNFWVAQLCPAFEMKVLRSDVISIPFDAAGIYRYSQSGTVVYIGKGNIRSRLRESGRDSWQFDTIEYSIVSDSSDSFKWESFWIERFREANNGRLPTYNAIAGHTE